MIKKIKSYEMLIMQCEALIDGEMDAIANMANISAALNEFLSDINWVGFYLLKEGSLVLGPFQGKPACVRITVGSGVCGRAVLKKETLVVPNVHEFAGHIACDSDTNSEMVIPIIKNDEVVGVLDVDSTQYNRFDEIDSRYLKIIANLI